MVETGDGRDEPEKKIYSEEIYYANGMQLQSVIQMVIIKRRLTIMSHADC